MIDPGATTDEAPLSPSTAGRREGVCDRFEAAWRAGQRPRIEDYLPDAPAPDRPALLRELLVVELAYRARLGERPDPAEYRARFPGQAGLVRAAFETMPTPPPSVDRPAAGPTRADADRNLLFGVLAMQMDFVSREALIAAVSAWALDKSKPLDQVLVEQGALSPEERALLEPLIRRHLERHGGDPGRSLAAVAPPGSTREDLGRVDDPDVQASVTRLATPGGPEPPRPFGADSVLGPPSPSAGFRFRVLRLLARGGLGEVFVARDEELRREVALKAIQMEHAGDPDSRYRFRLEAEITGRLEHPGIVPVYGLGRYEDDRLFYAMRLIRGESLKEAIARFHEAEQPGRDPAERALALRGLLGRFVDVCNAVAYAHSRGVLHRDLKPGNVMLGPYGETLVVDWGLAKASGRSDGQSRPEDGTLRPESASESDSTLPGSRLGTPSYMSPEQAAGRVDLLAPASDVYSLGATLYHLLTGRPPFGDADVFTILQRVQQGDFPPPRSVNRSVPPPLEAVCLRATAVRMEDRYPSPRALADDIEHWLADEAVSAYREPPAARLARWGRRHRPAVAGAAALLVAGAAALAVSTVLIGRESARREEHRRLAERNFTHARDAVDQMLTEVAEVELADVPQMQPVRKRLLEKAQRFYQGFLEQRRTDPGVRREAGRAQIRLGEIDELLGDHVGAERALRQGNATLADLVRDSPNQSDPLRDLARGRDDLGMLLKKANRFKESEAELRAALRLREGLAAELASEPADRQGLADSRYHLAVLVTRLRGRQTEDEAAYREALRMEEALVAGSRDHPGYRRKLARYLNNLGLLLASTGRTREAEDDYREAVAILEGFVANVPPAPGDRWQLARCYANLAVLLRAERRPDEAEAACLKAQTLHRALGSDFPDVPDYRHELASILNNTGLLAKEKGHPQEAERAFREALGLQEALAADAPQRPDYRLSLAVTRLNLSVALEPTDPRDALRQCRDALAVQERLSADFPEVSEYQRDLGRTLYTLARLMVAGGDPAEAHAHLARAVRQHRAGLEADPRSRADRDFLRDDYGLLCLALLRSGAHAEAADAAVELPRIAPDAPQEYLRAAAFLVECAAAAGADPTLTEPDRPARAESYALRAIDQLRQAVDLRLLDDPASLQVKELTPLRSREDFQELLRKLRDRSQVRSG
jgi:serine/threonine-protein kinase